jgi:hypothetical protein
MTIPTLRPRHLVSAAFLSVVVLGCRGRTSSSPSPETLSLSVQNSSEFQVNVYAVPSLPSARIRLGSVGPLGSGQLELPQMALGAGGELKVMVDPIGSTNQWVSPTIVLSDDTRPCLRLQADADGSLQRSTLYTHLNGTACP